MSGADYAHCDGQPCLHQTTKVFYDANTDIPTGTVIRHAACDATQLAAAEQRGYDKAVANLLDTERFVAWAFRVKLDAGIISDACARYLEAIKDQP